MTQSRCPHANACLNCVHFKTDSTYLQHHKQQLKFTNKILSVANKNNWHQQVEINNNVKVNLEAVIGFLEGAKHEK